MGRIAVDSRVLKKGRRSKLRIKFSFSIFLGFPSLFLVRGAQNAEI